MAAPNPDRAGVSKTPNEGQGENGNIQIVTTMKSNRLVRTTGAFLATIDERSFWVRSKAREIDLDSELELACRLSRVMSFFQRAHDFAGISSNNVFWEETCTPVRVILIPQNNSFTTVINPQYRTLSGRWVNSTERCGSIPHQTSVVRRKTLVVLTGYDIEGNTIELEYGNRRDSVLDSHCWVVQHEMDHLDGVLITDKCQHTIGN